MKILFLCPHGAAKSVLAATFAEREGQRLDLPIETAYAGTEPDEQIMPTVVAQLRAEGKDIAAQRPRHVTVADVQTADHIVSLGCSAEELDAIAPGVASRVEFWHEVPPVSQNLPVAYAVIQAKVQQLLGNLRAV
jgi:arsenate reductase (thioredoxin)